jgi:NAD+ kinase
MDGPSESAGIIGVVGDHPAAVDALASYGVETPFGEAPVVLEADPDVVVATGESALVDLVDAGVDVPVLPIGAGSGVQSVPPSGLDAMEHLVTGAYNIIRRPLLRAMTAQSEDIALFDLMLVTNEQARISEYTVYDGSAPVAKFRADGVVVATPAGSGGYAKAVDSPLLAPGTGVVSVVPVAPFATKVDSWVVNNNAVSLRVERDETPVELLVDGRSSGVVVRGEKLRIQQKGSIRLAIVEESRSFWDPN